MVLSARQLAEDRHTLRPVAVAPVKPPGFDARAANNAWLARVRKDDGTPYAVFEGGGFHDLNRWMLGIGEYDGKGLFDAVKTNAGEQNQIKNDLDALDERERQHHQAQSARIAALEAAANNPFPG